MHARDRIEAEIAAAGGWISFARYMQLALHEPGVGYYASGARKFGAEGDFVTAPELGSLFGRTLARELRAFDRILEIGAVFIIDYGFPHREYYHPQRSSGTLMCHHRHQAHADPFARPGLEDITAHVDFTALAEAAHAGGAEILGYASQAQYLVNCGITDVLGETNAENALHYAPIAAQAQKLLSPAEMGELFKVLAIGKDLTT